MFVRTVRDFYGERIGWWGALACAAVLTYVGGAAMFWYHSIYLGEGGPAISPWLHWFVDSTAGFLGLTPAILLIVPVAAAAAAPPARVSVGWFAVITGALVAIVTAPGPLLHDALIGRGTWLAAQVTEWLGNGQQATGRPPHLSIPLRLLQQIAFGIPLYIAMTWIALYVVQGIVYFVDWLDSNSNL